jgi:hypothetical protein
MINQNSYINWRLNENLYAQNYTIISCKVKAKLKHKLYKEANEYFHTIYFYMKININE